ncbi:TonB-dependent receptor [Shewanella sp. 4_MG-2023]|uniref:TonB-dependent receptor n=1 Tax=Shewanella sp. 4_MG-2023 TaxID=3062652 RepID=UPI0026E17BCC|nr:TonB-dependent receptor [Shewanella sp. 4_MG-2023]MDO6680097.1 TonB-dependent receptor [Shewanella sp. 4_MG-2023]
MPKYSKLHKAILLAGCSFAAFSSNLYAAEVVDAPNEEAVSTKDIEVIMVSAQKREQALKDVPVSIEVLDGDLVEKMGVQDGFDLVKYLPGFGIDDSTEIRTTTLKTRGIGTFTNSIGLQSSNLVVIDGEVLPRQSMLNLAVADVERVEALRGPQGTLFGQNTSTGMLHYVTKKPNLNGVSGKVRTELTQDNGINVSGVVNVPFSDNWAFRMNAQWSEVDGWIDNTMPGHEDYKIGEKDQSGLRGQLLYDDGEQFNILFRAEYAETDSNCCSMTQIGPVNPDYGPKPIINIKDDGIIEGTTYNRINSSKSFDDTGKPVTARNPEANYGSTENLGFSIAADYYLNDDLTLSYNGSYRDFDLYNSSGFFTLNFPLERSAFGGNESVIVNQQEIRLSSFDNEKFDWIVGLFYHNTEGQRSENRDGCIAGNFGFINGGELSGCYDRQSTRNFLSMYEGQQFDESMMADLNPGRLLSGGNFTTNFENFAIFGQFEYQITDQLDATFGFRALHEEGEATFERTDLFAPSDGIGMDTYADVLAMSQTDPSLIKRQTEKTKFSDSDDAFIYKAVVGYDFTNSIRAYVNYSTGYKGSSYFVTTNTNPLDADQFPTKPEQSSNFEVGLRTGFFDNDVLFNITYFDMTVEDYQVRATRVIDEEENIVFAGYVNAKEARSTGFEADAIVDITEDLRWTASYAIFDARYEDFSDTPINCPAGDGGELADRCNTDPVTGRQTFDQTGLSFPNNAEQQVFSTLKYSTEFGNTGWNGNVQAAWRYNGAHTQTINELALDQNANPSSSIWDLYFNFGQDNLRFSLYVKNLFDKPYTTRQNTNQEGYGQAFYPRDWNRFFGGSVQYSF